MDYERALEALRRQVEQTESSAELQILEIRLHENLERERTFGSTPARSSERFEIVDALNRLASRVLGFSFNDLLLGRVSEAGLDSPRIAQRLATLKAQPSPQAVPPPVEPRLQMLPFEALTWEQFELLCAALVAAQSHVLDCHLYGLRGQDQQGIDIVATQQGKDRQETWVYQCKRYQSYTAGQLRKALAEIEYPADSTVVLLGCAAGTELRDVAAERDNTFPWDAIDISRKLKNFPQLVQDFFGASWRRAFNP
jgi:hypothetical protein